MAQNGHEGIRNKKCPLCGREWPYTFEACPLKHCPLCGKPVDFDEQGVIVAFFVFLLITLFLSPTLVAIPALGVIVVLGLAALAAILSYYGPVWKCKDCGKHFTYFSLVRYVTLSPIAEKSWIVCPNCGAIMPPRAKFCGRCGHELFKKRVRKR